MRCLSTPSPACTLPRWPLWKTKYWSRILIWAFLTLRFTWWRKCYVLYWISWNRPNKKLILLSIAPIGLGQFRISLNWLPLLAMDCLRFGVDAFLHSTWTSQVPLLYSVPKYFMTIWNFQLFDRLHERETVLVPQCTYDRRLQEGLILWWTIARSHMHAYHFGVCNIVQHLTLDQKLCLWNEPLQI